LAGLFSITTISIILFLLYKNLPGPFDFYSERLFSLTLDNEASAYDFNSTETSEGYRVAMFYKVIEFISHNSFLGSGYLGVWILFDNLSGSAHNQYLDILFWTGILGFSAYVFLIQYLLQFLYLREPGLFWGVIGILIYGLVHETFKLSHGAFILVFLFGMMVQPLSGKPRVDVVP
jgi:O-antigen ligase